MIDLTHAPVSALLELHADLLAELRRRSIVRSSNSPTGDYGELLFSRAFGWTLNSNSSADADAIDSEGTRYQIKCRRLEVPGGSRQLGFIRRLPDKPLRSACGRFTRWQISSIARSNHSLRRCQSESLVRRKRQGLEVYAARCSVGH
jgi:hypothetical protein